MWQFIFIFMGLFLAACQIAEPIEVTGEQMTTAVPTLAHTPTPAPTATAVPTVTPVPILPPVTPADLDRLPNVAFDLLFMSGDALQMWAHESGQIETLVAEAAWPRYSLDAARQAILAVRDLSTEPAAAELILIEPTTGQIRVLLSPVAGLLDFALSPDGQSVAYTLQDEERPTGTVYLLASDGSQQTIAICQRIYTKDYGDWVYTADVGCGAISWSPDGQTALWRDVDGVWEGGWQTAPRLLIANEWFEDDPPRIYAPTQDWSPDGRYLLINARRGKGITLRVFDTETAALLELPHSLTALDNRAYWLWTQDNRLFTVRPPDGVDEGTEIFVEIWRVAETELVREDALAISRLAYEIPVAPAQLNDGRFAFALTDSSQQNGQMRGLYLLNNLDTPPQQVNALPPSGWGHPHLVWLPDGTAAIHYDPESEQIFFVPTDGSPLTDLTSVMGQEVSNLTWLP